MITKIILHGGFNKANGPVHKNDDFFKEMLKDTPDKVKVLMVYFAERDEMMPTRIVQDKEQLNNNCSSKKLDFRIATEETFKKDLAWADVIYLHGGRTLKLMEALRKYPNIKQMLLNRIIAGDSAGANALGQLFYSKNSKEIGKGLGILPIKIIVHYEDGMPNPLVDIEPQLETLFLHEYETKVFNI